MGGVGPGLLAARPPRADGVRPPAAPGAAPAAPPGALGASRRRFSRRGPPRGAAAGSAALAGPARARGELQLALRARAPGAGADQGLARNGPELPLLLRRAESAAALLSLRRDRRSGRGHPTRARRIGVGPCARRRLLAGRKRAGEVAGRAGYGGRRPRGGGGLRGLSPPGFRARPPP